MKNTNESRETTFSLVNKKLAALTIVTAVVLLASCSGGGGGGTSMVAATANGGVLLDPSPVLNRITSISTVASTVPANGDINPYGVAIVKRSIGALKEGHILVSNFNNSANAQGTGSTIVDIADDGTVSLFSLISADALPGSCPGGIGLTTALVVLRAGWVIVGSLPTSDGTSATAQAGCLIVLDSSGKPVETFSGAPINGPWDMTAWERDKKAKLFVTNVLNGTVAASPNVVTEGTVVRIDLDLSGAMPAVSAMTTIGSGFAERTDLAALVIGPTGVGLGRMAAGNSTEELMASSETETEVEVETEPETEDGATVLYVADSLNNSIMAIPQPLDRTTTAGTGTTFTSGGSLNDPLGLVVIPNGDILTVNGDDGFVTEITPSGTQIATTLLDNTGSPPGSGTLFGVAFKAGRGLYFVDDGSNTLNLLH